MAEPDKKPPKDAAPAKKTCFVIGPIGKEDSETRRNADNLFHGLIEPALQDCGIEFNVRRADHIPDPGSITEQVINAVVDSDLVIADLSERNPNAYYELGIRHAARRPTIHLIAVGHEIPFDNRDNRAISFDPLSLTSLRKMRPGLREQIRLCMASGYKPSNPVTLALGAKEIRLSADPKDRVVSDIGDKLEAALSRIDALESKLRGRPQGDPRFPDERYRAAYEAASRSEAARAREFERLARLTVDPSGAIGIGPSMPSPAEVLARRWSEEDRARAKKELESIGSQSRPKSENK